MNLPEVGGRRLEISLAEFERSCIARIRECLEWTNPDTRLIEVLCNAVRLAREQADMMGGLRDDGSLVRSGRERLRHLSSARIAHDEIPVLAIPNTAELTPWDQFHADVQRVISGIKK